MTRIRPTGRALLGALVSGALATGALSGAAPAEASCFSMFGIGNGNGCTSTLTTYAIALGDGAVANAPTLFGGSLAIGKNANASTVTLGTSAFNFATAIGENANALGYISLFGLALQLGEGTAGTFGVGNIAIGICEGTGQQAGSSGVGAIALQVGRGTTNNIGTLSLALGLTPRSEGNPVTYSAGFGSVALNLFGAASPEGSSQVTAGGYFSTAVNILGDDNVVNAAAPGLPGIGLAFNAFGSRNTVEATGPLAIAGSVFQKDATVTQVGLGFNINGLAVPGVTSGASVASVPRRAAASAATKASTVATSTAAATAQRPAVKAVPSRTATRGSKRTTR